MKVKNQILKAKSKKYNSKRKSLSLFSQLFRFFVVVPVILFFFVYNSSFVLSVQAASGINKQINFQGKLVDNNGLNVADNTYSVIFSIYNVSSSGTAAWTETDSVTTVNGIFQVPLGAVTSFPANVDFNQDTWYLGIKVGSDSEMTPRVRLTAVPYAFNADKLDGVVATQSASGFALTGGYQNLKTLTLNDSISLGTTIQPTATNALSVLSNGASTLTLDTGGAQTLNIGNTNANALVLGNTGQNPNFTLQGTGVLITTTRTSAPGALSNGMIYYDSTAKHFRVVEDNGSGTSVVKTLCNLTDLGCGAGGGGARLDQITAANTTATIDSLNNAINWNWSTLTTQRALTLDSTATGITTGGVLALGSTTTAFNHGASETGSLEALTFKDTTSNAFTTTTNGLLVSPTINATAGSATRTINGISVNPSFTACSVGSCAVNGVNIASVTDGAGFNTAALNIGAGWDTGILIAASGTGVGVQVNSTGTGSMLDLNQNGTDRFTVAANGGLTVNGADSSITRSTTSDFSLGTVGSNITNSNNRMQLSDGTPANSGQGTITTTSQPALDANIGAGALSLTRADGKYLVIKGGATGGTSLYDSVAGTFTNSQTIVCNGTTTVGIGALALPRPNGLYTLICGVAGSTTTATSNIDPMGITPSSIGPALITAVTGAGTVGYKRPDGKYLVTIGASTPGSATNVFDPVANTFVAGPAASTGTWSTGALALTMPDGRALIVNGGSTSTTNIYNPNGVSATIGTFTTGPSLDGAKVAGTCGINGAGSVAFKRQDGKYVILSKASVEALFDPSAVTVTCTSSVSNVSALGDGAHAIPLQNGKFLIFAGGNTTTAFVYNQDSDTFSTYSGTAPTAITTGAHSILRTDGTWQILTGTTTTTNNFNTGLPMSDPFPSQVIAALPSSGGSCTAGTHSYYVTFIGAIESELSNKSSIVSCTGANGTVALSSIPVGPTGTTARKVYRTPTGDTGTPQLLTTLSDNTTTTFTDTLADASLGAAYSVTPATTWYTSEDISNTSVGIASTLKWTAQLEAVYSADRNSSTNTAFKVLQFFVKTAVNSSGCATPLANAQWQEIQNSGDSIRPVSGANCVKVAIHFNRAMPKRLVDDRGTWTGNDSTIHRYDYTTPAVFDYSIDNSLILKRNSFDFSTPDSALAEAATVPSAPTSAAPSGTSGACTNGNHFWFVTFVINGAESPLSAASTVQSCSGGNQTESLTAIPTGPSGTTARKIYRTAGGYAVTDTPFLVGTINDNSTTTFSDGLADTSLGAAYAQLTASGPVATRGETTRVEATNNHLTLPWGRVYTTNSDATSNVHGLDYPGVFGNAPSLNNAAGAGTFVIARDDKTFLVVEGGGQTADLYDPATSTFTNQTNTGDKPTATVGPGAFAIRRPDGKYLVILGNNTSTTNIYDQYATPGNRFTVGPSITGTAINQGAFAMQNTDGTWIILPGNAATTTSVYDPVRNTMTVGPLQTTGTNYGGLAIPMTGPLNNIYKVLIGTTLGGGVGTGTMNYNANTKVFTAGVNLGVGIGDGALAFQRQDGFWVLLKGESAANTLGTTTSIINPNNGTEIAGTALSQAVNGRGTTVIPRSDGTFLITSGNSLAAATTGNSVATVIYFPWGGGQSTTTAVGTAVLGSSVNGPNMAEQGGVSSIAAPTTSAPASGGSNLCDTGTHLWRYTYVINGVESALSTAGTVQTCTVTTLGQEALTAITVGPTGTTARKVYRTKAGTTSPYFLVTTIADNVTTTFNDSAADSSLGATIWAGGPGDGAVSFQRPDGKFVTLFGASAWTTIGTEPGSTTTNLYDAGWYADGQYLSEEMNVPAMAANSIIDWQQTPDQYVRFAVRTAASQTALGIASYRAISNPGGSIENAANDTWVQLQVNFRRDFPTFAYNLTGVYLSSGGLAYTYRTISTPTVNSYQITNGQDLLTLQTNGLNMLRVTSDGNIMSSAQGGFFSGGADLAERYTSTQSLVPGEVVVNDGLTDHSVIRSTGTYQKNLLGIVSTDPGFVAGNYTADSYPIALSGRVPVLVSNENGSIHAGDYLTSASIPGYAMKATFAGQVIGKAMQDFDETTSVTCPSVGMGLVSTTKCGTITVFVNLINYLGAPLDVVMSSPIAGLESSNSTDSGILSATTDISIPTSNVLDTNNIQVLSFLQKLHASGGDYGSQILTGDITGTGTITSPKIIVNDIYAHTIHADNIDGLSTLSDRVASLEAQILFSSMSSQSAFFAIAQVAPPGLANGSGDLRVKGNGLFEQMLTVIDTIMTKNIVVNGVADFFSSVVFHKDATFTDHVTFAKDAAGIAIITKDSDNIDVIFNKEYQFVPIVTASINFDQKINSDGSIINQDNNQQSILSSNYSYIIVNKTTKGFKILLNKKATSDIPLSWTAVEINASTSSSIVAKAEQPIATASASNTQVLGVTDKLSTSSSLLK